MNSQNINMLIQFLHGVVLTIISSDINAKLKVLDENELSQVTAKAGLTIDIKTKLHIGEFEYVDAGSMFWRDISLNGFGAGIRVKVDISDGEEVLLAGFADAAFLADHGYLDVNETDISWATTEYRNDTGQYGKTMNDGDAFLHITPTGYGIDFTKPPRPNEHISNLNAMKNAAGFIYKEGEFGIRSSDKLVETILSRNFSVKAYLGYFDILVTNNGNGFHDTSNTGEPKGIKLNNSYIGMDLKFRVEDLDIDQTHNATNTFISRNVTQPYLTLRNMRIHNERGGDTLGSFGFASVKSKMAAATGILPNINKMVSGTYPMRVDGQAIYDINVKWDWDLPHISFGDTGQNIGKIYLTDFHINNTSLVISAH